MSVLDWLRAPEPQRTVSAAQTGWMLAAAALALLVTTGLSLYWQRTYWVDLNPPLCSSRRLMAGQNPYQNCHTVYLGAEAAGYPLTTILALAPFSLFPGEALDGAVVWGVFNGLLVYGLLRNGQPHQLLLFLSAPYWSAFTYHQFSPLIAAIALLPSLLPLALIKPQIGLPVMLTHLTPRRIAGLLGFLALTFLVFPSWPQAWYISARNYDGQFPVLMAPLGLLLLAALLRRRDPGLRLLFLTACMPQRAFYDLAHLFLLPGSLRQMLIACLLSWAGFIPVVLAPERWRTPASQVWLALVTVYLPILGMLLFQHYRSRRPEPTVHPAKPAA